MPFKHQSSVSPFRRMIVSRGLTMLEVAVCAKVSVPVIRKFDRMDKETIGSVTIGSLLRVAMFLGCSAVDLVPFLGTRATKKKLASEHFPDVQRTKYQIGKVTYDIGTPPEELPEPEMVRETRGGNFHANREPATE